MSRNKPGTHVMPQLDLNHESHSIQLILHYSTTLNFSRNTGTTTGNNSDAKKIIGLSEEEKILIKKLYYFDRYSAVKLLNDFPASGVTYNRNTVNDFTEHLKQTGTITGKPVKMMAQIFIVLNRTLLNH